MCTSKSSLHHYLAHIGTQLFVTQQPSCLLTVSLTVSTHPSAHHPDLSALDLPSTVCCLHLPLFHPTSFLPSPVSPTARFLYHHPDRSVIAFAIHHTLSPPYLRFTGTPSLFRSVVPHSRISTPPYLAFTGTTSPSKRLSTGSTG